MQTDRQTLAIEINRRALLRVMRQIAMMLPEGVLTRGAWLAAMALLRPAESAARRLIALLALGMVVPPSPPRARIGGRKKGGGGRSTGFPLFDRRRRPGASRRKRKGKKPDPRIRDIMVDGPVGETPHRAPMPDDPMDGARLMARIAALWAALDDLPKLARRLATIYANGRTRWVHPIRTGRPPGHRRGGTRPVDRVLADCHGLFWMAVRERERVPP